MLWQRPGLLTTRLAAKLGGEMGGDFGWRAALYFASFFLKKKFFHGSLEISSFRILYLCEQIKRPEFWV